VRDCGTCSACCRWPEIPELRKPRGEPCAKLKECGHGCTAYVVRPRSCSEYQCAWSEGYGNAADQPDKCGVLIERRDSQFGDVLVAKDLMEPAGRKRKLKAMRRISRDAGLPVVAVAHDDPERVMFVVSAPGLLAEHPKLAHLELV
jgi:hypothetical protein